MTQNKLHKGDEGCNFTVQYYHSKFHFDNLKSKINTRNYFKTKVP
jgi:hypothetical protein